MIALQDSYRQIMKATSVFGGVQVINILLQIVKSKLVAILLGPGGMGIHGLLIATQGFIGSLTGFGLGISGVKDVAAAKETGDNRRVSTIIAVLNRWIWVTGLLGVIVTLIFAPLLSQFAFGSKHYTLAFIWIAITLLFNQVSAGQLVILQGLRKIKFLANASITGSLLGLVISVPIYFLWKIDGIVPAIIATSLANMIRTWYFAKKVKLDNIIVNRETIIHDGKNMLRMGFILSLSGLVTMGASFLVRVYISNTGGINDVGLYTAGFAIIVNYVGVVFTAMSMDYYPRLSGIAHDNVKANSMINQQAEIAILLLSPILTIFMVFINWVIILLYSSSFIEIKGMIQWAALGMFFKAVSWSIAYVFLAKGESKLFLWNELFTNVYLLVINILGYKYGGLNGLGVSFFIAYILYFIQVYFVAKIKFEFKLSKSLVRILIIQFSIGIICFLIVKFSSSFITFGFGSVMILISGAFSLFELNKKLGMRSLFLQIKNKGKRKY